MASGAWLTVNSTMSGSQSPAPAVRVSWACDAALSSGDITAATPPWAQCEEPEAMSPLQSTVTRAWGARCSAADSPAAPPPMMRMSVANR